jgi:hypothetical protein
MIFARQIAGPRLAAKTRYVALWLNFHKGRDRPAIARSKSNVHFVTRLNHPQLDSFAMQKNRAIRRDVKELNAVLHKDGYFSLHRVHAQDNSFYRLGLANGIEARGAFVMLAMANHRLVQLQAPCRPKRCALAAGRS